MFWNNSSAFVVHSVDELGRGDANGDVDNGYGDVDENGGDGRVGVGSGDADADGDGVVDVDDDGGDGDVRCTAGAGSPIRSSRSLLGKPAGERLPWKTFSFSSELEANWPLVSNCFANLSYVSQL